MLKLSDVSAERAVLSGIMNFGHGAFMDVNDILTADSFTDNSGQAIFHCLEHILKDKPDVRPDPALVFSAAQSLKLDGLLGGKEGIAYLRAVKNFPAEPDSIRPLAAKVRKLQVARSLDAELELAQEELSRVTGDEPAEEILAVAENRIMEFGFKLEAASAGARPMADGARQYILGLMDNPKDSPGFSSGFCRWDEAIGGGLRPNSVDVWGAKYKTGKAQPLDAIVMTPEGPKTMGDIRVGDTVCTPTGTTWVSAVYPQGVVPIYRVTFSDGDAVECCDNHLWEVKKYIGPKRPPLVKPLNELRGQLADQFGRPMWSVRLNERCDFSRREVPLDPYLLGVILGNGCTRAGSIVITTGDEEVVEGVRSALPEGYELVPIKGDPIGFRIRRQGDGWGVNECNQRLRDAGLWGSKSRDKFVPHDYLLNDEATRLSLLQGLLDTDGTVDKRGLAFFSTTSRSLAQAVKFLVQSLGGLCSVRNKQTTCNGKKCHSFVCSVRADDCSRFFRLARKKSRCKLRTKGPLRRSIRSVELVGEKPAQCIQLATEDGLYLTNDFVVTHNTFVVDNVAQHVSGKLGIPVFNLDTELVQEEHLHRVMACMTGIPIREIETGRAGLDPRKRERVEEAIERLESMPYEYECVAGKSADAMLASIRRWLFRRVGFDQNGHANPCLVIYDYLKLTNSEALNKNVAEYQAMGFIMTALKNLMSRYRVACKAFVQLNREGDVAQSDRIRWLCTSYSVYRKKTPEEVAEDPPGPNGERYTHCLEPGVSRHGPGCDEGNYINMLTRYDIGQVTEGPWRNEVHGSAQQQKGFVFDGPHDEEISIGPREGAPLEASA